MIALVDGNCDQLVKDGITVPPSFFMENVFSLGAVNSKTFILLLAENKPLSFISGAIVNLDEVLQSCNRTEFHHIFPKNYLHIGLGLTDRSRQYALANFAFLSQKDNRSIRDRPPSDYVKDIPETVRQDVLVRAYIPENGMNIDYLDFLNKRAELLASAANNLLK